MNVWETVVIDTLFITLKYILSAIFDPPVRNAAVNMHT